MPVQNTQLAEYRSSMVYEFRTIELTFRVLNARQRQNYDIATSYVRNNTNTVKLI